METYGQVLFRGFTTERFLTRVRVYSRSATTALTEQPSWEWLGELLENVHL